MQYDFKQRWTEGSGFMLDVVDQYCWETHRKVITPSETGVAALRPFGICSNTRAGQPLRTHIHSGCIEIVFLIKGFQLYEAGGDRLNLSGSDIFVSYPDEPHSSGSSPESVCDLIWMQICLDPGLPFFGLDKSHAGMLRDALAGLPRLFTGDAALRRELTSAFYALCSADDFERCLGEQQLACALFRMVRLSRRTRSPQPDSIEAAIAYIRRHLSEPILLEDAAASCGLSLSRFKVRFKEATGDTPREYINRLKIERAKLLLRCGQSVTETALDLGFATPSYFSVIFKKYAGCSPSAYLALRPGEEE